MAEEGARRRTQFSRSERRTRILERLRQGFGYDEVAREERLTERRVRQIVKEYLDEREALEGRTHAHLQIDRLGNAMRVAGEALARGDIRAIAPLVKVLDRLDHYQTLARQTAARPGTSGDDRLVVKTLVDRIRRMARNEFEEERRKEAAATAPASDGAGVAPPAVPEPQPEPTIYAPPALEAAAPRRDMALTF